MPEQSPDDPVVELLIKPENVGLACEIYNAFPDAVNWVGKVRLLRILHSKCRERLKTNRKWEVSLEPDDNRKLLEEQWPYIDVKPRPASDRCWRFYLQMAAKDLPYTFRHGIGYEPDKGGRPQSMSQKLQAEVEKIERLFKAEDLKVRPWPDAEWFSYTDKPYKRYTLGDDPQVLKHISTGALADWIANEFFEFFDEWSPKVELLNSLLG